MNRFFPARRSLPLRTLAALTIALGAALGVGACTAAGPGSCGDSFCRPGESESCTSCAVDCGSCAGCGDGTCAAALGESCASCLTDCGMCPDTCGNGTCDGAELCSTCPADCMPCPTGCTTTSCTSGCCDGDSCVSGASTGACGSGGRACMACGPGFLCTGGACVVDPASRWNVFVDEFTVEATYFTGVTWDTGSLPGSLPDPYVGIAVGTSGPYRYTPEPTATNTLTVPYSGAALLTDIRADALVALALEGWDDDGIGDDPFGACSRPVPPTAFSETVQSTTCPRDAAASQSGFTVRWHLERF